MPSVVVNGSKRTTSILNRSESLRSEFSDASQSKKVSFNKDVRIRRIPQNVGNVHGQVVAVLEPSAKSDLVPGNTSGCLWINSKVKSETAESDLLDEAKRILNNVDKIQCTTSPTPLNQSKPKSLLERSKSELIPNGFRRSSSEPPLLATGVSKFLDVDYPSNRLGSKSKLSRVKKPRVGLDGIAGDSGSSSSSSDPATRDGELAQKAASSDSPSSSLSSDIQNMTTTTPRYGSSPRVASMANKLGSMRRENAGPPLRSSFLDTGSGHTHNNNQPFSYTGSQNVGSSRSNGHDKLTKLDSFGSPTSLESKSRSTSRTNGQGAKTAQEIIYAQVVSREKKDGTPEKRTIHKRYSDMTSTTPSDSPDYQKHIRHFVYDKENWKNLNESHNSSMGDTAHLLSNYRSRGSQYGSRNNVTTVLLNSNDEEDSLRSTTITNNDLFKNSSRSSSSPPRLTGYPNPNLTDRPFFYGDTRVGNRVKTFDHSSSSSPQFHYSSSSRENSPAGVMTTTKVSGIRKAATIPPPEPKITSTSSRNHTDYQYMTSKLGYLTPSEYSVDVTQLPPKPQQRPRPASVDRVTPKYEQTKVNGWSRTGTRTASADYKRTTNGSYNPYPTYASVENNRNASIENHRRNSQESENFRKTETKATTKTVTSGSTHTNGNSSGGGLISSLMRRSKDKKVTKDKVTPPPATAVGPTNGKVKPRNKFLSLFFDSKNGAKKSDKSSVNQTKTKHIVTDSEIDDAERKRDGEYHSWSSVDDAYRMVDQRRASDQRPKDNLSRGKSYNFGSYGSSTKTEDWYKQDRDNDSAEDYRRDLAKTNYKSATLGRPPVTRSSTDRTMSSSADAMASRTKSLDRRTMRPTRYDAPPKLIITPSTPAVDENGYRWEPSYPPPPSKTKLDSKMLSKSSVELNSYGSDRRQNDSFQNVRDASPTKLRYFGDTDAESSVAAAHSRARQNSRFDSQSPSFLAYGKMDQGYHGQNGNDHHHVSRRDTLLRKGHNDGINSSEESESRFSKSSSRSVFLHAPTVAEIPPPGGLQRRTLSRDEISNYSGPQRQTRHLARSMSVLAPWRPRPKHEKYEVRYDNEGYIDSKYRRPPKPPRSPNQKSSSPVPPLKHRSESSENLLGTKPKPREINRASTLGRFGGALKRSKSTAVDSSNGSWFSRNKETQRR